MTIGKFYRVTGESTQHRGVEPDVPLPSVLDTKEVGESALESALPWDRIAGVPFKTSAGTAAVPPVAALATEEDARAQHDPDYRWLVSDIAAIDSVREQHSVSLNLKTRREERTRMDQERLERENSRRAAKNLPPLKSDRGARESHQGRRRRRGARSGGPGHGGHGDRRTSAAGEDRPRQRIARLPAAASWPQRSSTRNRSQVSSASTFGSGAAAASASEPTAWVSASENASESTSGELSLFER